MSANSSQTTPGSKEVSKSHKAIDFVFNSLEEWKEGRNLTFQPHRGLCDTHTTSVVGLSPTASALDAPFDDDWHRGS